MTQMYTDYFARRNIRPEDQAGRGMSPCLKKVLPSDRSAAILDIGCGLGQVLAELRKAGYSAACGVDISQEAVTQCLALGLNVEEIASIPEYCAASATRFDLVIMSHVLEHLPKDEIIDTLWLVREKLMKPGAALFIATPNAQANTGAYWAYEDFTHNVIFTAGSLIFVLRAAGFNSVEILDPAGLAETRRPLRWIKRLLLGIYRARLTFWNRVTGSAFHRPGPQVFTYAVKALARSE
jgi:SAM-dependent methyltransferase